MKLKPRERWRLKYGSTEPVKIVSVEEIYGKTIVTVERHGTMITVPEDYFRQFYVREEPPDDQS
jgi:hypothetical protein